MNTATAYQSQANTQNQKVSEVTCICGHRICDNEGIIRSRCVKLLEGEALCRCKCWVKVPLQERGV